MFEAPELVGVVEVGVGCEGMGVVGIGFDVGVTGLVIGTSGIGPFGVNCKPG